MRIYLLDFQSIGTSTGPGSLSHLIFNHPDLTVYFLCDVPGVTPSTDAVFSSLLFSRQGSQLITLAHAACRNTRPGQGPGCCQDTAAQWEPKKCLNYCIGMHVVISSFNFLRIKLQTTCLKKWRIFENIPSIGIGKPWPQNLSPNKVKEKERAP